MGKTLWTFRKQIQGTLMKILCTGNVNHRGIAKTLSTVIPDVDFISRSNGWDLSFPTIDIENRFREKLQEYDVLINNSYVGMGAQKRILQIAREVWQTGHVINIGSMAEHPKFAHADPEYAKDKQDLRDLSIELGDEKFKTTHMVLGAYQGLSHDSVYETTMSADNAVSVIKWVIEAPFEVPIIGVERMNDALRKYFDDARISNRTNQ